MVSLNLTPFGFRISFDEDGTGQITRIETCLFEASRSWAHALFEGPRCVEEFREWREKQGSHADATEFVVDNLFEKRQKLIARWLLWPGKFERPG